MKKVEEGGKGEEKPASCHPGYSQDADPAQAVSCNLTFSRLMVMQPLSTVALNHHDGTPLGSRPAGSWELLCWRLAGGDWSAGRLMLSSQLR